MQQELEKVEKLILQNDLKKIAQQKELAEKLAEKLAETVKSKGELKEIIKFQEDFIANYEVKVLRM